MVKCNVSLAKKSSFLKVPKTGLKFTGSDFIIMDNQDDTATVQGVDSSGFPVDISTVATLTVKSSDPTIITVDPPTGMTFKLHALKPSTPGTPVVLSVVATWNDSSIGPFEISLPCDVTGSAATGIIIVPGTPTVR